MAENGINRMWERERAKEKIAFWKELNLSLKRQLGGGKILLHLDRWAEVGTGMGQLQRRPGRWGKRGSRSWQNKQCKKTHWCADTQAVSWGLCFLSLVWLKQRAYALDSAVRTEKLVFFPNEKTVVFMRARDLSIRFHSSSLVLSKKMYNRYFMEY